MSALISLGIAFFVIVLLWLTAVVFTPDISSDRASGMIFMSFIGTGGIAWVVLKYLRGPRAMIRRILIPLGAGIVNFASVYGVCFLPAPQMFVRDAAIIVGVSAVLSSLVTLVILSLPTPLPDKWRRVLISLSAGFFMAVFMTVQITSFLQEVKNITSIFAGVFIGTALITALVLRLRSRPG